MVNIGYVVDRFAPANWAAHGISKSPTTSTQNYVESNLIVKGSYDTNNIKVICRVVILIGQALSSEDGPQPPAQLTVEGLYWCIVPTSVSR